MSSTQNVEATVSSRRSMGGAVRMKRGPQISLSVSADADDEIEGIEGLQSPDSKRRKSTVVWETSPKRAPRERESFFPVPAPVTVSVTEPVEIGLESNTNLSACDRSSGHISSATSLTSTSSASISDRKLEVPQQKEATSSSQNSRNSRNFRESIVVASEHQIPLLGQSDSQESVLKVNRAWALEVRVRVRVRVAVPQSKEGQIHDLKWSPLGDRLAP
jgi:hypothetical protein